jgi:hypothetical protein
MKNRLRITAALVAALAIVRALGSARTIVGRVIKQTSLIISYEEDGKEHFDLVPLLAVT